MLSIIDTKKHRIELNDHQKNPTKRGGGHQHSGQRSVRGRMGWRKCPAFTLFCRVLLGGDNAKTCAKMATPSQKSVQLTLLSLNKLISILSMDASLSVAPPAGDIAPTVDTPSYKAVVPPVACKVACNCDPSPAVINHHHTKAYSICNITAPLTERCARKKIVRRRRRNQNSTGRQ